MINAIFGYDEDSIDKKMSFFSYDEDKFYSYKISGANYAVVDTNKGYKLIKVYGYGNVANDTFISGELVETVNTEKEDV